MIDLASEPGSWKRHLRDVAPMRAQADEFRTHGAGSAIDDCVEVSTKEKDDGKSSAREDRGGG